MKRKSDDLEYTVELTQTAEQTYSRLFKEAKFCLDSGDKNNSKVATFRMLDEFLNVLIPRDPFSHHHALAGNLSEIFRVSKGGMKIFYVGSPEAKIISVLCIFETPRKSEDFPALFRKFVLSGKYNKIFDRLGVELPDFRHSRWVNQHTHNQHTNTPLPNSPRIRGLSPNS